MPSSCQHSAASATGLFLCAESCRITTAVHVRLFFFLFPNPSSKHQKVLLMAATNVGHLPPSTEAFAQGARATIPHFLKIHSRDLPAPHGLVPGF